MAKHAMLALLLALLCASVYGSVVFEKSLADFGYESFEASEEQCKDFYITLPKAEGYAFLILELKLKPSNTGNAKIEAFLNGKRVAALGASELKCNEACIARVPINKEFIKEESLLKICLKPSRSITKIELSNSSKIAYYKMPVFEKEDFRKCIVAGNDCVERYEAVIGEDLNVRISVRNSGNEDANILVESKRGIAGERSTKKEIGEAAFEAVAKPNETLSFYYIVRVKEATRFNLPPSALYYTDAFSEQRMLLSNTVTIIPRKTPEINAALIVDSIEQDGKAKVSVVVSNNSGIILKNVEVRIISENATVEPEKALISVGPRDTNRAKFLLSNAENAKLSCLVTIADYNFQIHCPEATVFSEEKDNTALVVLSILLVLIAIGVFLYLNSQSE